MCTFLHFALAQSSLIPTWTLRFQRRTLWEQVSSCPELWLQGALRRALGHCSRLHSLRWRSYGCWVVSWFLPGARSPWRLFYSWSRPPGLGTTLTISSSLSGQCLGLQLWSTAACFGTDGQVPSCHCCFPLLGGRVAKAVHSWEATACSTVSALGSSKLLF